MMHPSDVAFEALYRTKLKPSSTASVDGIDSPRLARMTSQVIVATGVCETKAVLLMTPKAPRLPPSDFAKAFTSDGVNYEDHILQEEQRPLLVRLLNQGLKMDLPSDTALLNCSDEYATNDYKAFLNRQIWKTLLLLENAKPGVPCIYTQAMLGRPSELAPEIYECGRPDLLIWTGAEWFLGDIKRSEIVSASHGVQVRYYAELAVQEWASLVTPPAGTIATRGFILHCAPGYLYTGRNPEANLEALAASKVDAFQLTTLQPALTTALTTLTELVSKSRPHEQRFSRGCVECLFRRGCYHDLLLNQTDTHLSFLPLPSYEYKTLREHGLNTLEQVVAAGRDHPVLLTIKDERHDLVDVLLRKAAVAIRLKGFSNWRSKDKWDNPAFFASDKKDFLWSYGSVPTDAPPCPMATTEVETVPLVVVAFSEVEIKRAKRSLRAAGATNRELQEVDFVCLSDEMREQVHFPMMSYTLRATAAFFRAYLAGVGVKDILREWFAHIDGDPDHLALDEQRDVNQRLTDLQCTWLGLLRLEKECHR